MRGFWIGVAVFVGACYLYINYIAYPTFHFRFKLTVEVQTPDGLKAASVVDEDSYSFVMFGREFMSGSGGAMSKGEALFIDLGSGKNIVVTNYADDIRRGRLEDGKSDDLGRLPLDAFRLWQDIPRAFKAALVLAVQKEVVEIPIGGLPTLITLPDINGYKSMQRVDPAHLDQVFGPGYAIKRATVEITDEPLTEQIEAKLPWLAKFRNLGTAFDGSRSSGPGSPMLSKIYYADFKLERR